mgnify:CR=1 FL=1
MRLALGLECESMSGPSSPMFCSAGNSHETQVGPHARMFGTMSSTAAITDRHNGRRA